MTATMPATTPKAGCNQSLPHLETLVKTLVCCHSSVTLKVTKDVKLVYLSRVKMTYSWLFPPSQRGRFYSVGYAKEEILILRLSQMPFRT